MKDYFKNILKMDYPAAWWSAKWREGIPVGNGSIGASIYGAVHDETVLLTHEDLWSNCIHQELPDVSDKLSLVREHLLKGEVHEADQILVNALKGSGYKNSIASPLPLGDLKIITPVKNAFKDYSRSLNMETGEATVSWNDGLCCYTRKLFVSRTHELVALKINGSESKSISGEFYLDLHDVDNATKPFGYGPASLPQKVEKKSEGDYIYYAACNDDGTDFGAVARIEAVNGKVECSKNKLIVCEADEISIYIKVFVKGNRTLRWKELHMELAMVQESYDKLLKVHAKVHGKLFRKASFTIGAELDERNSSNEQLLLKAYKGEAPAALIEKMWAYGRYLLISSSREGGQPCPLVGLWAGDYEPFWSFNMANENIQMIYWQALSGNIPEVLLAMFDYYDGMMDQFRTNARNIYGCKGIFIPAITTPGEGLIQCLEPHIVHWTGAAGWIAQHYFDYYLYTGDKEFLSKRALPFMKEVIAFYQDFFILGDDGYYISAPSNSPENTPANYLTDEGKNRITLFSTTINATMDFAIAKEVLTNTIQGGKELGGYDKEIIEWKEMLYHIPPYQINDDGALTEWMHPFFRDNYKHRHQSHIYPVFPGSEVTEEENPELFKAFVTAIRKRLTIGLTAQSSWSLAHMACVYARMGEGDLALECLDKISQSALMNNLFTVHNDWRSMGIGLDMNVAPFQIDANMGWTAAIQEMLLFSKPGFIKLLPALPRKWRNGRFTGFLTKSGTEISSTWDMDRGRIRIELQAKWDIKVRIKVPGDILKLQVKDASYDFYSGSKIEALVLRSGQKAEVNIFLKTGRV